MKTPPYFDLKQHLQEWYRYVLPLFVVVGAVVMLVFIVLRTGSRGPMLPDEGFVPARIGLLSAVGGDSTFDAAFAVFSPIEMVLAPRAAVFDSPLGGPNGSLGAVSGPVGGRDGEGAKIHAVADGMVVSSGGQVLLLHGRYDGTVVGSVYGNLASVPVAAGSRVRRGDVIGTVAGAEGLRFDLRHFPSLATGGERAGIDESAPGALAERRGRGEDRLSRPPTGEPLEPASFHLEMPDGDGKKR